MSDIIFEESTDTIRQVPENYLLAERVQIRWVCDPDLACDKLLAHKVFMATLDYDWKYASGPAFANHVSAMSNMVSVVLSEQLIELYFGKTCTCDMCAEEVSRTLDELMDNEPHPKCLACGEPFELVSVVGLTDRKNMFIFENKD